jgi:hypothetical protein
MEFNYLTSLNAGVPFATPAVCWMSDTLKQLTLTERERSERDLRILYSSLLIGLQKVVESFPGFINPQLWLVKGTKYIYSIYLPQCMSPRRMRLSHPPLLPASVPLPPESKGGREWGSPSYDDWRKCFALCQLCG